MPPGPPSQCGLWAAVARAAPAPRSGGWRRLGTGWAQWGSLPSVRAGGWLLAAAGHRGRTSMSLATPWCVASGVAPTARGSRGHGLGPRCRPSPTRWRSGGRELVVEQGGGAVRQGRGRREHAVSSLQAPVAFLNHLNKFSPLVVRFYATCGRRGWLNQVVTHCSRPWLIVAQSAPC